MAGFTPLCQQPLPLPLSISLDSLHPPSNQHSYSPTLLHLRSPCLPRSSSLPLSLHFKLHAMPSSKHETREKSAVYWNKRKRARTTSWWTLIFVSVITALFNPYSSTSCSLSLASSNKHGGISGQPNCSLNCTGMWCAGFQVFVSAG